MLFSLTLRKIGVYGYLDLGSRSRNFIATFGILIAVVQGTKSTMYFYAVAGDLSRTAEFFKALSSPEPTTFLVATVKLRLKSRKMALSNQIRLEGTAQFQ